MPDTTPRQSGGRLRQVLATVIAVAGIATFVIAKLARREGDTDMTIAAGAVALVCIVVAAALLGVFTAGKKRRVALASLRPGAELVEVYGALDLAQALAAENAVDQELTDPTNLGLTLVLTPAGFELWKGGEQPTQVIGRAWADVAQVVEGTGKAGAPNSPNRTLAVLTLRSGTPLAMAPARKPTGSPMVGSAEQARALVAHLEGLRASAVRA